MHRVLPAPLCYVCFAVDLNAQFLTGRLTLSAVAAAAAAAAAAPACILFIPLF
jgi:hypothetical protein